MIRPGLTRASRHSGLFLSHLLPSALTLLALCANAATASAQEAVAWTPGSGTAVSGSTVSKTGPEGWNATAISTKALVSGDGALELTVETAADLACGLSSRFRNPGYEGIDFALRLGADGTVGVYESGTFRSAGSPFTSGDSFRIAVEAGVVRFYQNGQLLFASATAPAYPLSAMAALASPSATISSAELSGTLLENVIWTNGAGVVAWGSELHKRASTTGWDAGAVSTRGIASTTGYVEIVASETTASRMIGLSGGDADQGYADIDFALHLGGTALEVYESGTLRGSFGSYATGDRLRVAVENGVVRYRKNGALLYESSVAPSYPLLVDSSLETPAATLRGAVLSGEIVDVGLAAPTFSVPAGLYDTTQTVAVTQADTLATNHYTAGGAEPTQSDATIASGDFLSVDETTRLKARSWRTGLLPSGTTAATYTISASGSPVTAPVEWTSLVGSVASENTVWKEARGAAAWDAGAVSTKAIASGDGWVESVVEDVSTLRAFGLSLGDSGQGPADIDFALYVDQGTLYAHESGAQKANLGQVLLGDHLRVAVSGGAVTYVKNGQVLRTSDVPPSYPLLVDTALYTAGSRIAQATISGLLTDAALAAPVFSPAGGTYATPQNVGIAAASGATIRYTMDGSDPTPSSTAYSTAISVDASMVLKARAWSTGYLPSAVASASYALQVATPIVTPAGGLFLAPVAVAVSCATPGAVIRCTTDGTDPSETSALCPTLVSTTTDLRARAFRTDWAPSSVAHASYQIGGALAAPVMSPAAGTYINGVEVTISAQDGTTIHYTTDGSTDPSEASPTYSAPLLLASPTTVKAKAFATGWESSPTTTGIYTVKVAAPSFSHAGGTYSGVKSVRVTSVTPGAVVHYTTSGAEPTETDPAVGSSGRVLLAATGTLKAKAFKSGLVASDTVAAAFSFERRGVAAAGGGHSLVATPGGSVWAWGQNANGQLGDNTSVQKPVPVLVQGVSDVIAVAAGSLHSLALTSGGRVWSWGANNYGQLGNGSTTSSVTARYQVQDAAGRVLDNVVAIAAGENHSLALRADGTVWAWGSNASGQVGDGATTTYRTSATPVPVVTGAVVVGAGATHSLAASGVDGTVWAWGLNSSSQLGDGTTTTRLAPKAIGSLGGTAAFQGGSWHSLALGVDGLVYAWGLNSYGQLGDGTNRARTAPVRVADLQDVSVISSGTSHGMALAGGDLWVWGSDAYGQLGDGGSQGPQRVSPFKLPAPSNVIAIAGGVEHALAIDADGVVWAWGRNSYGEIGDGTAELRTSPVQISDPGFAWRVGRPVMSPAPGTSQAPLSVTLTSATPGASFYYSTDGGAPTTPYTGPVSISGTVVLQARATKAGQPDSNISSGLYTLQPQVPTLSPAANVYTANQTVTMSCAPASCASLGQTIRYTTDGSDPSTSSTATAYAGPVLVDHALTLTARAFRDGWTPSTAVSGTYSFSRGTLAAPTFNPAGGTYVGSQNVVLSSIAGATIRYTLDGTDPTASSTAYSAPITLSVTTVVKARAFHPEWTTSPTATATYTIKVAEPPTISLSSGEYPLGQAVTLTSATGTSILYTLDGSAPTTSSLNVPSGTTLYLMRALTLKAATFKTGCLPSDPAAESYTVTGTAPVATVDGGGSHSLLAKPDGNVWAWGNNQTVPAAIASLTSIVKLDAGANHSMALKFEGPNKTLWAWGSNGSGQLGFGDTTSRTTPAQLPFASDVIAASAGGAHTLAVRAGGSVWAWGSNSNGQLGTGSTTPTQISSPNQVTSLSASVAVSAGGSHSLAIENLATESGTVWAWGNNTYGQLGDNSTTQRNAPVRAGSLVGIVAVAAGDYHSLALKNDGTVSAWGLGTSGQLGDGPSQSHSVPTQVPGLTGAVAVASAAYQSFAVLADGSLWAWGYNYSGMLGDGTTTNRPKPVRVPIPAAVIAVGAATNNSFAITLDGTVWAWGYNTNGQLGLGMAGAAVLTPTPVTSASYVVRVAVPTFSPAPGSYSAQQAVHPSSLTSGATICYTTDGTDPSGCATSVPSGGTVTVAQSLTLRAIATKSGMPSSAEAQAAYTLTLDYPVLAPAPGVYSTDQTVTMTGPAGATVRYTTDGTEPTETTGTLYLAPVPVTRTQTIRARAFKTGWSQSVPVGGAYGMRVANPTFSVPTGSYATAQTVALATTTPGAPIHYTTDGREPTLGDPVATSVFVDRSMTLRAKAFRDGWTTSDTVVAMYVLALGSAAAPAMDPPAGSYDGPQLVELRSTTPGAKIRYTLDGTTPTLFSRSYLAPLVVDETATLKAVAFAADLAPSSTTVAAYTIAPAAVAAPRFTPSSGPFPTARLVTVTCATTGALIHYTMNGADPTMSDPTIVSGQTINVDRSMTLKAAAWLDATASAVRVGNYHVTGAIAAGGSVSDGFSLALRTNGHVSAWGSNANGQLGTGNTTNQAAPTEVLASAGTALSGVIAIDTGYLHSLALKTDGHVWAWGSNAYGQLATGATGSTPVVYPVEVKLQSGQPLTGVVAIAAGQAHSVALTSSGTVYAWGQNAYGQVGDGTSSTKPYAVSVLKASDNQPLTDVVAIAAGSGPAGYTYGQSLALRSDGSLWGWGYGSGVDGSTNALTRAIPISGPGTFVGITAGSQFSAAIRVDGSVWAWGQNGNGQLGNGSTTTAVRPERTASLTRTTQVDVGPSGYHVVALVLGPAGEQKVWTWGAVESGQMGDTSLGAATSVRTTPAPVPGMVDVVAVSAGGQHSMALLADGSVWTWGNQGVGALGRATTYPYLVSTPGPVPGFVIGDESWMTADPDADGLPTSYEWRLGTDALKADTNGDGVSDGAAVRNGLSATATDADEDGVRNTVELARGTNPLRADTDNDGVPDGQDCYPLDPTRSTCPVPDPGDHTPPLIILTEPTNAILTSSLP
jgi:alpha-tubulin suppressor-like RCC1 family protein